MLHKPISAPKTALYMLCSLALHSHVPKAEDTETADCLKLVCRDTPAVLVLGRTIPSLRPTWSMNGVELWPSQGHTAKPCLKRQSRHMGCSLITTNDMVTTVFGAKPY